MGLNPNSFRPEVQERKQRLMRHPEYAARRELERKARGTKKVYVGRWNHEWAVAGYPVGGPSFDEWLASPAGVALQRERAESAARQRKMAKAYASWVAAGQKPEDYDKYTAHLRDLQLESAMGWRRPA